MKSIIYIIIGSVIVLIMSTVFTFISTIIEIYTLGNRVEDSLIAAGWAGFSEVDLDMLAVRKVITNEELRDIYLDEPAAVGTVTEYIKENLKLDGDMYPTQESYISYKSSPVIIDEISVYNPDELPATCSRGITFDRTTVHIALSIPADIKWLGFRYLEKHIDVDIKSFLED